MSSNRMIGKEDEYEQNTSLDTSAAEKEEVLNNENADNRDVIFSKSLEPHLPKSASCQPSNNLIFHGHRWDFMTVIRRGNLVKVELTQSGLTSEYANVLHLTLVQNPRLQILKLGYNALGDDGISIISPGIVSHLSLKVLDVGFNLIGDLGCSAISKSLVGNAVLETLYLSGNSITEKGIVELSQALKKGCGLLQLHLTANKIGALGVSCLANSIAESNLVAQGEAKSLTFDVSPASNDKKAPVNLCDTSRCLQEVYLGGTFMRSEGCLSLAKMLLTNSSLRILSLPNNNLSDCDAILLARSLSRNKQMPLEKIQLSFNKLTCVGVEALMNSIWGSKTLRELKIDNNNIKDRGAQLAAVVLTSVDLELLDIGFNLVGAVGIKALMKTLADNTSLRSLTLSGNILDSNSARAVSYALALNKSLTELFVDNCSATYGAQRHITAGIVSNKMSALRILRGFSLGAIAISLGFPAPVENWSNDQLLKFISFMWHDFQLEVDETSGNSSLSSGNLSQGVHREMADPKIVIKVANAAFEQLNDPTGQCLLSKNITNEIHGLDESSTVPGTVILEISESGSFQIPREVDFLHSNIEDTVDASKIKAVAQQQLAFREQSSCSPERKRRLAPFLQIHCDQLEAYAKQPFNKSEMWKLYRFFFSPLDGLETVKTEEVCKSTPENSISDVLAKTELAWNEPAITNSYCPHSCDEPSRTNSMPSSIYKETISRLYRRASYRSLHDAISSDTDRPATCEVRARGCKSSYRHHSFVGSERDEGDCAHSTKRARGSKLRVDLYPRIKIKLEVLKKQTNDHPALILMRQLLYLEQRNMSASKSNAVEGENKRLLAPNDIEALLLDLL
mmetsp:Transcript_13889/g.19888  ORF Transcript_13889/g.19888 Transcript_13889/m.19888 type:complete len:851 (-) Transcript_13889:139-2691(-)